MSRRFQHRLWAVLIVGGALVLDCGPRTVVAAPLQAGDEAGRATVWDGVYTPEQAQRGQAAYETYCSRCHGLELAGTNGPAPSLKGEYFMERWREFDLDVLFDLIRNQMPPQRREPLPKPPDESYLDILTYVLKANAFPSGSDALSDGALSDIRIERQDGPHPLASNALVQVVGCLVEGEGGEWLLIRATEPIRTLTPDEVAAPEIERAHTVPLGAKTFFLRNFDYLGADFSAAAHRNETMIAKGLLVLQPDHERINLTSLERVDAGCER